MKTTETNETTETTSAPKRESKVVIKNRTGNDLRTSLGTTGDKYDRFIALAAPRNYNIARSLGFGIDQSKRIAYFMTRQQGLESGYGTSGAFLNGNNRSGMRINNSNIVFPSHDANDISLYKSFSHNPNWLRGMGKTTIEGYTHELQYPKKGEHAYEAETANTDAYLKKIQGGSSLNKALDKYFKSGASDDWTMVTPNRRSLEETPFIIYNS